MSSRTARFVHRPIPDYTHPGSGTDESSQVRQPLIDREGPVGFSRGTTIERGWFSVLLARFIGIESRGQSVGGRKLDPQRWLPRD